MTSPHVVLNRTVLVTEMFCCVVAGKFLVFLCQTLLECIDENKKSNEPPPPPSRPAKGGGRKKKGDKKAVAAAAAAADDSAPEKSQDEDDDDSVVAPADVSESEATFSVDDEELMVGLLECMLIMWQSVRTKLEKVSTERRMRREEKSVVSEIDCHVVV